MIGRGAYGKPWLLGQVMHWFPDRPVACRSHDRRNRLPDRGALSGHADHYGAETGVKIARKHLGWYTRSPGSAEFRNRVNFIDDPREVLDSLERFYAPVEHRAAA